MKNFICIHGHFYQPPRENPWLQEVELEESAYPYHDWNQRITSECYGPNAASRILNANRKIIDIVNNFSRMSFNFGPTLLSWLEKNDKKVYDAIIQADVESREKFSGHGSAIAQVYNHIIMPLANSRDKETQIIWGIEDFKYRFSRMPEGMWLAETAVDTETLELLAKHGIKYTILAPRQAKAIRPILKEGSKDKSEWHIIKNESFDTTRPYQCQLPSGAKIALFFYNGGLSQAVAFEGLLNNGEHFANKLLTQFNGSKESTLIHIATDGESYGHHHKHGDMALAYCLYEIEKSDHANLTIYGEYLEKEPPTWEAQIHENTSWSCYHGVGRWKEDCGCHTGGYSHWNQEWRFHLRNSLNHLRDAVSKVYQENMVEFTPNVWNIRNDYIHVLLNRTKENVQDFLEKHNVHNLNEESTIKFLRLLEMQHNSLLMFTSCGWFFDEISGIESVQILRYAARTLQLVEQISSEDFEGPFLKELSKANSNLPNYENGTDIYNHFVKPSVVNLLKVGAQFAFSSLFKETSEKTRLYSYMFENIEYEKREAGRLRMAIGQGVGRSRLTWRKGHLFFIVLHLGDHNFLGGVDYFKDKEHFESIKNQAIELFMTGKTPSVIQLIHEVFDNKIYTLWDLFKYEQQEILNQVLQSTMDDIHNSFKNIYENHYSLIQIKDTLQVPLPQALLTVIEFVINRDLCEEIESDSTDIEKVKLLIEKMIRFSIKGDVKRIGFAASIKISQLMTKFQENPYEIKRLHLIYQILDNILKLNLPIDLWKSQNIYYNIGKKEYLMFKTNPPKQTPDGEDFAADIWNHLFESIGQQLNVNIL